MFSFGWPGDLVFDHKWPSFKVNLKNIKTNILSKTIDDYFKNMTARVLTRFSFDLPLWPSFWPQVTWFQTDLEIIHTNILSKIHDDYFKIETSRWALTKVDGCFKWVYKTR